MFYALCISSIIVRLKNMKKTTKWILLTFAIVCTLFIFGCANNSIEDSKGFEGRHTIMQSNQMMVLEEVEMDYANSKIAPMPAEYRNYEDPDHYESAEDIEVELKIIQTANIRIEVEDYFLSSQKVEAYAKKYAGYVSHSDARASHDNKHSGTVTIRVPAIHFDAVIAELSILGTVKSKNVNGQDVTEEYIDLQARINNSKSHEERLINMYDDANNVNEMMQVERELNRVREQIERWEGRLRYLNNKVDMSTITVNIYEPVPVVNEWGIWNSIKNAVNHSLKTLRWMIEFIGVILPLLIMGALIWMLVWLIFRRNKKVKRR